MPVFAAISHEDFVAAVATLRDRIAAADWTPDFLIGIGRGGLTPAVYLSHAAGLPMLSVDHSSQVRDFADDALVRLAARTRAGERLLFLDDINDSGRTIAYIRRALATAGAEAGGIRFATLIDNVSSAERVDYAARVIDRRETKDWFVFPWEAVAPAQSLAADAAEVPDRIA
ncbi:phosphoribosyltransferase domain-containing protein [Sphingomonas sp. RP10(2022)]|uniref:Phosphoribosyltransferase domain-containing protein n=1 Tax=Sphingomonas liriopis TaxID=2949094 RepID=A0A9X2HZ49_9SPHN|nr:phosphoribosyltransferase domain-containing protein [Sphingomonas liriopis]MCP3736084.1 phosphoribosyltransferase domain-containing protein [Sphingomonas liriopis]